MPCKYKICVKYKNYYHIKVLLSAPAKTNIYMYVNANQTNDFQKLAVVKKILAYDH